MKRKNDQTQELLADTKKEISIIRKENPGPKRATFPKTILENIKVLSENFTGRELAKNLSVSSSTIYKAKQMGKKTPKINRPFKFLEVQATKVDSLPPQGVKVIMEFKTKSGMTISIFE